MREMMKKALLLSAALLMITVTGAIANITGSKHDFSSAGWNSSGEICKPCHTPHNADTTVANSPLWNHELSTASYTMYASPTFDSLIGTAPTGVSKLCLSCHDGTRLIHLEGLQGGSTVMGGVNNLGTDLSDDHPVSFAWAHETVGSCSQCHSVHPSAFISPLPFFDGQVECATCYDPHSNGPEVKFLRMTRAGSALCLHCHNK